MFYLVLCSLIVAVFCDYESNNWNYASLQCRDNYNNPVDWWFLFKPPNDSGPSFESGRNFTFITSDEGSAWRPSDRYITSESMLRNTLEPLYRPNADNLATFVYHSRKSKAVAPGSSALGIMMADEIGGLWISHTVPGFPNLSDERVMFPVEEFANGHSMMCLTLDLPTLNELAETIKRVEPRILRLHVPFNLTHQLPFWKNIYDPTLKSNNKTLKKYEFLTRSGKLRAMVISRQLGDKRCLYKTFAMSKKIVLDVYHHGHTNVCEYDYGVRNFDGISMKFPATVFYINNKTDYTGFAVSTERRSNHKGASQGQYWACISNMEKDGTSADGGFILCIEDYEFWWSFDVLKVKDPEC